MPFSEELVRELKQAIEVRQLHGSRSPTPLEWWYFTGHLWKISSNEDCSSADDTVKLALKRTPDHGVQSTFFLSDKGEPKGLLAHSAESNLAEKKHSHVEMVSALASASVSPIAFVQKDLLNVALGHWRLNQMGLSERAVQWDLRFDVRGTEYLLQLEFPTNKIWFHGKDGWLQKTNSTGNFYYSVPFVVARGMRVSRNAMGLPVGENVCGRLWFDHEIHVENVLDVGWRWFGLSFSNKKALMFYEIQSSKERVQPKGELWDESTGKSFSLENVAIVPGKEVCLASKNCYPQSFSISFRNPQSGRLEKVETSAAFANQEISNPGFGQSRVYWEGSTRARWFAAGSIGTSKNQQPSEGIGFTELVPQVPGK
ncbi:MAG: lipocalin-like domain-containing protein [Silvanigrellaceae bacterium]